MSSNAIVTTRTVNLFDPKLMVTVVDVTKGVQPDVLYYNLKDVDKTLISVEPNFENSGDPEYTIPRFYAERLLGNYGGRTFRLVSPYKLPIKVSNGRGGCNMITLTAFRKRGDGNWYEMTDEEILEETNPGLSAKKKDEEEKPLEEEKRVPVTKKKTSRKEVVEEVSAPLSSLESDNTSEELFSGDENSINSLIEE